MIAHSHCEHCQRSFEFEMEQVSATDQTIRCPHCGQATQLLNHTAQQACVASGPGAPAGFIKTPEPKSYQLNLILPTLGIIILLLVGIFTLQVMAFHAAQVRDRDAVTPLAQWDYEVCQYQSMHRDDIDPTQYVFYSLVITPDGAGFGATSDHPLPCQDLDDLLNNVALYGWELTWSDGKTYVFKRPRRLGHRDTGFFLVRSTEPVK